MSGAVEGAFAVTLVVMFAVCAICSFPGVEARVSAWWGRLVAHNPRSLLRKVNDVLAKPRPDPRDSIERFRREVDTARLREAP